MDVRGITIDNKTTRDRDDAIWVESDARGWSVTVCVANVALHITKGSQFDDVAHSRVETNYMAGDRNRPMLPRRFSEGACSLTEGQSRPVMAIRIRLDHGLETQFISIDESDLTVENQLTYRQIPDILDDEAHPLYPQIHLLAQLANGLMEKRRKEGAFVLYDLRTGWIMSEEGYLRQLKDTKETFGHIIVQEMMILANAELAKFCAEKEIPIPFRNHRARASAPERKVMMEQLNMGIQSPIANLDVVRKQFAIVMDKASYSSTIEGHYGLNVAAYTHATSPIRRYADLVTQRQVLAYTTGLPLPYDGEEVRRICEHINATLKAKAKEAHKKAVERANQKAERAISKEDLKRLNDKEFERVIKVAVRAESFNFFVAEAFLDRLQEGAATLVDIHFILFKSGEDWQPIRRRIIDHLVEHPHQAISIAGMCRQLNGWDEPKYLIQQRGGGNAVLHVVQVRFPKMNLESSEVVARSKRLAKQRAIVEVIAIAVREDIPTWKEATRNTNEEVVLPPLNADNPVGALSEYCQALRKPTPKYDIQKVGGSAHNPTFVATCQALDMSVESPERPNKKDAKKQAAATIIRMLHGGEIDGD